LAQKNIEIPSFGLFENFSYDKEVDILRWKLQKRSGELD